MIPADVGTATRTAPEEPSLSLDRTFDLLANEHRRAVVTYLLDTRHEVVVEELTDALADGETDETRVATSLHHAHLPKLEAAGMIEWDCGGYVEATPRLADLEPFLRAIADFEGQVR